MQQNVAVVYLVVAAILFLSGIFSGKVLKKDVLHGGVRLGILNSALLSIVWPLTCVCMVCGWVYDMVQAWKKL